MTPPPAYLDWLYDAVCFKASHNSYHGKEGNPQNPAKWDFDAQYQAGCRGFELDLYQCDPESSDTGCEWSVSHEGLKLGKGCWPLSGYLSYLQKWSGKQSGHDPVFVVLDLKSVRQPYSSFADDLDPYINKILGGQVFGPRELLNSGAPDLVRAVRDSAIGWPPIAALMNRFIFCLSGTRSLARAAYAGYHPAQRLCFTDLDLPEDLSMVGQTLTQGHQVVINCRASDQMEWGRKWLRNNPGFLLRVYGLGTANWRKAVGKGPNVLATDYVTKLSVGAEPFVKSP
jgi:hypothetical protein